jgi:hypothetical protein
MCWRRRMLSWVTRTDRWSVVAVGVVVGRSDALVGPMRVVELLVLVQGVEQVPLVPDQRAVKQFAAAALDPAFHDRVHSWDPDAAEDDLDARAGKSGVKQAGNFPSRSRIRKRGSWRLGCPRTRSGARGRRASWSGGCCAR